MTSSFEPVEPVGDRSDAAAGPPPRRASLLDVRFSFVDGGSATTAGPLDSPGPADRMGDAVPPSSAAPTTEPTAAPEPVVGGMFVTETMAELYRAQGLPERALEIYRTLLARDPAHPALLERVRELEGATPHLTALSFDDVRLPTADASAASSEAPSARAVLRALGARRVEGSIARDLGAAAAAIGDAPWQATGARDDAFADWT